MKRLPGSLLTLILLLSFSCITQTDQIVDIESEKAAIQKVIDDHMDAMDSLNMNKLLDGLTEDHLDMPPNMPPIIGKEAYKEFFTSWIEFFSSLKDKDISFESDEFIVAGEWAFQIGTYSTTFITLEDNVMKDKGNYVWIFKKGPDGIWKWARVISNSTLQHP